MKNLLIVIFILFAYHTSGIEIDFTTYDKINHNPESLKELIYDIKINGLDKLDYAMTLYLFITDNFKYDDTKSDFLDNNPDEISKIINLPVNPFNDTPKQTFEKKKGLCFDISRLYKYICTELGINCYILHSKAHAYNSIYIDGVIYEVDCLNMRFETELKEHFCKGFYKSDSNSQRYVSWDIYRTNYKNYKDRFHYKIYLMKNSNYIIPAIEKDMILKKETKKHTQKETKKHTQKETKKDIQKETKKETKINVYILIIIILAVALFIMMRFSDFVILLILIVLFYFSYTFLFNSSISNNSTKIVPENDYNYNDTVSSIYESIEPEIKENEQIINENNFQDTSISNPTINQNNFIDSTINIDNSIDTTINNHNSNKLRHESNRQRRRRERRERRELRANQNNK